VLIAEAKRSGIPILPIDINHSTGDYTVEKGAIRISLRQLKGMSEEALKSILAAREEKAFISLRDFIFRTGVSRPIIENLIRVGAFDSLGNRSELLHELTKDLNLKHKAAGVATPMFEEINPALPDHITQEDINASLISERQLLSLDLSAHPLEFLSMDQSYTRMKDLRSVATGKEVKIAGSVIRYQTPPTRNGNRVVYIIMEDGTGIADVTVFGDVQQKCGDVLFKEGWLSVKGKVQRRGPKSLSIIAGKISALSEC
jgi:error-prone DNA polymerase